MGCTVWIATSSCSHYCQQLSSSNMAARGRVTSLKCPALTSALVLNCVGVKPQIEPAARSSMFKRFLAVWCVQAWRMQNGRRHISLRQNRTQRHSRSRQWWEVKNIICVCIVPLVSGPESPAGARCAAPPADHGASPESPPAADRKSLMKPFMMQRHGRDTNIKFLSSSQ